MPRKLRKRRESLWQQFEKRCYWCDRETVFPKSGCDNKPKVDNLATIEHLRSKLHHATCEPCKGTGAVEEVECEACDGSGVVKDRYEPNHSNEQRLVLACLGCNGLRAKIEGRVVLHLTVVLRTQGPKVKFETNKARYRRKRR